MFTSAPRISLEGNADVRFAVIFMALSPPRARSSTIEDTRQDILRGVCSANIERSVQA